MCPHAAARIRRRAPRKQHALPLPTTSIRFNACMHTRKQARPTREGVVRAEYAWVGGSNSPEFADRSTGVIVVAPRKARVATGRSARRDVVARVGALTSLGARILLVLAGIAIEASGRVVPEHRSSSRVSQGIRRRLRRAADGGRGAAFAMNEERLVHGREGAGLARLDSVCQSQARECGGRKGTNGDVARLHPAARCYKQVRGEASAQPFVLLHALQL